MSLSKVDCRTAAPGTGVAVPKPNFELRLNADKSKAMYMGLPICIGKERRSEKERMNPIVCY